MITTETGQLADIDSALAVLQAHKGAWARLNIGDKIDLLNSVRNNLAVHAKKWIDLSADAKKIPPESPWVGEEWISGPWAMAAGISGLSDTLAAIRDRRAPSFPKTYTRPDGRLVVRVFPSTFYERLLLSNLVGEVWMEPGVTLKNLSDNIGAFYRQVSPKGEVALVLGAGNINSIAPLDLIYQLYAKGRVGILKMNPVNAYLGPLLEEIFSPLIESGFVRFAYGDAEAGTYLTEHGDVDFVHLTGSKRTYEAIVFGTGAEGQARKETDTSILNKPMSSELGGVNPLIVVPGAWTEADVRFQAERIVTAKLHNTGCNCVAAQVVVMPRGWNHGTALINAVRDLFKTIPERKWYYPGAEARHKRVVDAYPGAEIYGDNHPRTLVANIDPNEDHSFYEVECFGPALGFTELPAENTATFLQEAVAFCNRRLYGTLGATIVVHPKTRRKLGRDFDEAVAALRYGTIGVNVWNGAAFLLPHCRWGAFPGHVRNDIGSGIGFVHNAHLFDRPERSVVYGAFSPAPRSWQQREWHISPKPLWFVTNENALEISRRVTELWLDPRPGHLPGIIAAAYGG